MWSSIKDKLPTPARTMFLQNSIVVPFMPHTSTCALLSLFWASTPQTRIWRS
uniref:Uncharacterized protein n=1 Tax=Arundo donax TaxID=35708 RepID=A0A0A9HNP6_ARUDO